MDRRDMKEVERHVEETTQLTLEDIDAMSAETQRALADELTHLMSVVDNPSASKLDRQQARQRIREIRSMLEFDEEKIRSLGVRVEESEREFVERAPWLGRMMAKTRLGRLVCDVIGLEYRDKRVTERESKEVKPPEVDENVTRTVEATKDYE